MFYCHWLELSSDLNPSVQKVHSVEDEDNWSLSEDLNHNNYQGLRSPVENKKKAMIGMTLMSLTGESKVRVSTVKAIPPF